VSSVVAVSGEAAEVASAEVRAILSLVQDEERRGKLADLAAALADGEVAGEDAQALEEVLELALQTGRVRALYGPEGETAALALYRRLPRGRELSEAAREVSAALAALEGRRIEQVTVAAGGPAAHVVTVRAEGLELSIRLDRQCARLTTVGI
jgi:CHASE3 domain sensor protein